MNEHNLDYYAESFYSKKNFKEFYFISQEDLNELHDDFLLEMKRVCCSRRKVVKNKYKNILNRKIEEYRG
jgi:hypothetical protein